MTNTNNLALQDGGKLVYEDHPGNGTPIIMIHGFPLNRKIWKAQIEALIKAGRRVIAYDMRGFGDSSDPTTTYSHEEDLLALIKHLNLSECHLVGMSFGGEIATSFTVENPNLVRELTLVASGINGYKAKDPAPFDKWSQMVREGKLEEFKNELLKYGELGELQTTMPEVYKELASIIGEYRGYMLGGDERKYPNTPTIEQLSEIKCATNIIVGLEDSVDSLEQTRILVEKIPGANLDVVEGVGHFVNLEKPGLLNGVILRSEVGIER